MKILVIDDQPYNVASAHLTLKDHDYKVVDTIKAAYDILESGEKFDVVLTDLWMPRGDFTGAMRHGDTSQTIIPAGLIFAIKAANDGMKVVICTDSDHHQDRLCSVLDLIRGQREKLITYIEANSCPLKGVWENGQITPCKDYPSLTIKNWLAAMINAKLVPWQNLD